jgi:hypothetical protein
VQSGFAKVFSSPRHPLTAEEKDALKIGGSLKVNTSESRHVWLPIRFDGDQPVIDWRSEWTLDEFA